jgi:hypothetical protein
MKLAHIILYLVPFLASNLFDMVSKVLGYEFIYINLISLGQDHI